jgi:predicted permease
MSAFLADDIGENITKALSSTSLWVALASTVIIILIGFYLTHYHLLPEKTDKILTQIVMLIFLPCLAFTSFMTDFTAEAGLDALVNFVFGFFIYLFFIFFGKLLFRGVKDPTRRMVLAAMFAFGSTTFIAQPVIDAIFGTQAYNDSNMLNVAFRVFLYSYAYLEVSGLRFDSSKETSFQATAKKIFLNPILLATFLGLFLWVLQAIPGATEKNSWTVDTTWLTSQSGTSYVPFWRVDVTLPWIFQVAKTLGALSSPIVYLAIGCTLGSVSLKDAAKDRYAWIFSLLKTFLAPAIVLLFLYLFELIAQACSFPQLISIATVQSSVLMWMVPPGVVVVAYCIRFDKEKILASDTSLIGTLFAIPGILFWVLILSVIAGTGFFYPVS